MRSRRWGPVAVIATALLLAGAAPAAGARGFFQNGSVTIVNTGRGSGEVHLNDPLLVQATNCFYLDPGESCISYFVVAPFMTLGIDPYPAEGSYVAGWSLPHCQPAPLYGYQSLFTSECDLHLAVFGVLDQHIDVNFALEEGQVQVATTGTGHGQIRSNPGTIACTGPSLDDGCWNNFLDKSTVTLTATPDQGSRFTGWSGSCSGTAPCVLSINGTVFPYGDLAVPSLISVAATFSADARQVPDRALLVSRAGPGAGVIRSEPRSAGIDCGRACHKSFPRNARVVLRAFPAVGSRFSRWSPGCENQLGVSCVVTMRDNRRISAIFALARRTLRVTAEPGGTVTSAPQGIACRSAAAAACARTFEENSTVGLIADPDDGFAFAGWAGSCQGTGGCVVRMDTDKAVEARFVRVRRLLVTRTGAGAGAIAVRGGPAAATECNLGCGPSFPQGTVVTITAQAGPGSTFAGFSGNCTGATSCSLTMNADKQVGVSFDVPAGTATLTVALDGAGQGRVTSAPAGIDCRPDCLEAFTLGTRITLTAQSADGSRFAHFAGPCAPATGPSCRVELSESRQVLAAFDRIPPPPDDTRPPDDRRPPDAPPGASGQPGGTRPVDTRPVDTRLVDSADPNLTADDSVDARIASVRGRRSSRRRIVRVTVVTEEFVTITARLSRAGRTLARRRTRAPAGRRIVTLRVRRNAKAGRARLDLTLRDAAGNRRALRRFVRVPRA